MTTVKKKSKKSKNVSKIIHESSAKNHNDVDEEYFEEYRNPVGRPSVMTPDRKEAILEALRGGLPQRYSAHLVGIHHETLRLYLERDVDFLARVNVAKAIGISLFKGLTAEQNGAWKILKNIGRDEFRENIQIEYDESKPITIAGDDGEPDEII